MYGIKEEKNVQMLVGTGHLVMMDASVQMDIQQVRGVKNMLLGGESLFNTVVTGPGRIVIQTMPMSNFVQSVVQMMPSNNS